MCSKCGYEWTPTPDKLLQGRGCPSCSRRIKGSVEQLQKDLDMRNKHIKVLGDYKDRNTPIKVQCTTCGYTWSPRPYDLIHKIGCPKCNKCAPPTQEEVIFRIKQVSPHIEVLSQYKNANTPLQCKCLKCGCEWEAIPGNLFNGTGCPKCNKSKGERLIESMLMNYDIKYLPQFFIKDPFGDKTNVYIDFYLPQYNTFIEYNGEQHYIPINYFGGELKFRKQQERDEKLRIYCKEQKINLIEIKYTLKANEIQEIIKNIRGDSK